MQSAVGEIAIRDSSLGRLIVDHIQTSRPCPRVEQTPAALGRGESSFWATRLRSSGEPDFLRDLSIGVAGRELFAGAEFRTHVNVEVKAEPTSPPLPTTLPGSDATSLCAADQGVAP